jgi:hypothetical protein
MGILHNKFTVIDDARRQIEQTLMDAGSTYEQTSCGVRNVIDTAHT